MQRSARTTSTTFFFADAVMTQQEHDILVENNMLLKAIYQKLLENESNDFQTNVAANIVADMIYGKR